MRRLRSFCVCVWFCGGFGVFRGCFWRRALERWRGSWVLCVGKVYFGGVGGGVAVLFFILSFSFSFLSFRREDSEWLWIGIFFFCLGRRGDEVSGSFRFSWGFFWEVRSFLFCGLRNITFVRRVFVASLCVFVLGSGDTKIILTFFLFLESFEFVEEMNSLEINFGVRWSRIRRFKREL